MPVFLGNSAVSFYRGTTAINLFLGATPLNPEIPDLDVLVAAGMNYASPSYYSIEFPFRDLMRKCNTWRAENVDGEGYFDHPLPPMSPEGYPLEMPGGGATFLDLIITNHYNEAVLGNTLHMTFDGDADAFMTWPTQTSQNGPGDYTINTNGATALTIRVTRINPANPIRNLKIETSDPSEFRQAFLDRQSGMRVMRFMDWMNTNFSPIETFDEWPTEDDFPSVGGYNRVPISVMCRAANAAGVPPWFCIPHLADDDFVERFAYEVAEHIDPTLPIYMEYSNECWNSMFGQYQYCVDRGSALGLPGANQYEQGAQFYGLRARQIEEIIRPIFGSRLKMVFAWQAVNPYFGSVGLDYNDTAAHMDVLAIAPYFGSSLGDFDYPPENPHSQQVKDGGLPFVFSYLKENIDTVLREAVSDWAGMAQTYGCEIACYEAGQHLVGNGPANDDLELRAIFLAANRDPRMATAYKQFAQMWTEETPEDSIVVWYNSIWEPTASGFWGAMETEADTQNHKWVAIRDMVDDSPVDYPEFPPFPDRPEPEPEPEPEPLRLQAVATRGEINNARGNAVSTGTQKMTGRSRHYTGSAPLTSLQIGFAGYYVEEVQGSGDQFCLEVDLSEYTIGVAVEINGGPTIVGTFGGAARGTVPAGSPVVFSDDFLPLTGLSVIPPFSEIYIRFEKLTAVGGRHGYNNALQSEPVIPGERFFFGPTTAPSRLSGNGPMGDMSGWTAFGGTQLPCAIIGIPAQPMPAYGVVGASIEHGAGETGRGDGSSTGGYIRRAMFADKRPYIGMMKAGESARSFVANSTKRRALFPYATHMLCGHGGNDYSYGLTLANTQTRWAQIWQWAKEAGSHVSQINLSPKTDSSNSWATVAGQTPRAGFGPGGAWKDAGENWIISQVNSNPNLDRFIDLGSSQEDSTAANIWRVDLGQPTTDGTHPTGPVHTAMANYLRTLI